jgi:hypothetical protein
VDTKYPTIDEPATKEYVLSVLRDTHRRNFDSIAADGDEFDDLTFDTTISDWKDAWDYDLMLTSEFGRSLNRGWQIDCTTAEWRGVLKPAGERRLEDLCAFIASRTTRPRIRPAHVLGRECDEAGAFLTIRSLLAEAGADPHAITPSTPLAEFTRRNSATFFGPISNLAPGALPPAKFDTPIHDATFAITLLSIVLMCLAGFIDSPELTIASITTLVFSYAASWIAARWILPKKVQFGDLTTFRDLARVVAASHFRSGKA